MPKIVDHDQYRQELLSKAFDVFAKHGYASITMRKIAEGLGVSTGTLYHYFPSKEALFEQLVEYFSQKDLIEFTSQVGGDQPLGDRIHSGLEFIANHYDDFFNQMVIWIEFYKQNGHDAVHQNEVFKQVSEREKLAVIDLLGIDDPKLLAFVECWHLGLILYRVCNAEPLSFGDQAAILTQFLLSHQKSANPPPRPAQESS